MHLPSFAQSNIEQVRINYQIEDEKIIKIFRALEKEYNIRFSYATESIEQQKVSVDAEDASIDELLDLLLEGQEMEYKIVNNNILIRKNDKYEVTTTPIYKKSLHLKGKVVNATDEETLPFAFISVSNSSIGTYCDEDGNFDFEIPTKFKNELITIQYIGHEVMNYQISELEENFILIALQESGVFVEEILVVNQKKPIQISSYDNSNKLNNNQLNNTTSSLAGSDLSRQIQLMAGVNATDDTSADIKIRGSNGDETLIILDGMPIYNASHYYGIFNSINTNYVEEVSLYKNTFPIQYGGKTGGVVVLNSEKKITPSLKLDAEINLLNTSINTQIPLSPKSTLMIAGRSTLSDIADRRFNTFSKREDQTDIIQNFFENVSDKKSKTNFNFRDVNLKYLWTPDESQSFSLNLFNSSDKFNNTIIRDINDQMDRRLNLEGLDAENWSNIASSINYKKKWNSFSFYGKFYFSQYQNKAIKTFDISRNFNTQNENEDILDIRQDNKIRDFGTDFYIEQKKPQSTWTLGFSSIHHNIDINFQENNKSLFDQSNQVTEWIPYIQNDWNITEKWSLKSGLRSTYYDGTQQLYFSPRALLQYHLSDNFSLKSAYTFNQQFIRELPLELQGQSRNLWISADGNEYPVLQAHNYMFGATAQFKSVLLDVELYNKNMDGILQYSILNPNQTEFNDREYRLLTGTGLSRGIDITLSTGKKNFDTYLTYTLSKTTYSIQEIAGGNPFPSEDDRRHQLKFINTFRIKKFDLNVNYFFSSGRRYTDIRKINQNENILNTNPREIFSYLPAYNRLDLGLSYHFDINKLKSTLNISLLNILNNQNVKYIQSINSNFTENGNMINAILGSETPLLNRTLNISWKVML